MQNLPGHENGLYHLDIFKSLLAHQVNISRRYGDSLTLVNLFIEAEPAHPETLNDAELFVMNRLRLDLRDAVGHTQESLACRKRGAAARSFEVLA